MRWVVFILIQPSLYFIARSIDMPKQRLFKAVIVLSAILLLASCAPSTTTNNSHGVSHTYEGHNTGGKGWH
ncbi:hypothetical protein D6J04_08940 [Legionella taurinensis]|uniref:Uncharacterized protein n=1 Tax=Legionella taurinensis TaxID=70611 RepID=A0A3A5LMW8_9GAMM|nr:hypothetical protein D6J04_08940 [Legionella taurinensis]RJT66570.1 hypothetical protein D6J03_09615 [Legionella taurinensis]